MMLATPIKIRTMDISDRDTQVLIGDLSVALAALRLQWDLEDRGLDLRDRGRRTAPRRASRQAEAQRRRQDPRASRLHKGADFVVRADRVMGPTCT